MAKTVREKPQARSSASGRAAVQHRKLLRRGLGDRFEGLSERKLIEALKKTREEIWQEKFAARA